MSFAPKVNSTGTWFDDIRIAPNARTSGINAPTFSKVLDDGAGSRGIYAYIFTNATAGQEKEIFFMLQMPHGKVLNSAVHIHLHWTPLTAGTAGHVVRWALEYSYTPLGVAFPTTTTIYAPTVDLGAITTQYSHILTDFPDISAPANETISSILWGRLFRDSANGADTYTGDAGLLFIDAHLEMSQLGSNDEFIQ